MTDNAARFVGNVPEFYDRGLGPIIFVDYAADIARRVGALKPARVLETAAGTGIVTRALRDALSADAQLTATDLNPPMLDVAATKIRSGERVVFQAADAQALPFVDASFDAVVCQFGIMFYPDKPKSYREVHRVLAPGGRYVFNVWDAHRYNPFGRIGHEVSAKLFPNDPPQFYSVPFSCAAIDPIKQALLDAGFTDVAIAVVTVQKEVPDVGVFARAMVLGNPLAEQIRGRGGDTEKAVQAIGQELRRDLGDNPARMAIQAIVFSARKPG
ncbi:class I SAM-dependent methyltransferase [soil metagenome]